MKHFIKGMTLLLAGISFMACSKDVAFDENAQKQAQAEAAIQKKFAEYEVNFINQFGSISSTQDWGFGNEAKGIVTRGESFGGSGTPIDCGFEVPNSITVSKNGNWGNGARDQFTNGKGYTDLDALYANYWIQHVNKPEGGKVDWIEAWDSSETPGKWVRIANFNEGKNESEKYFQVNSTTHGTTLMTNMGGAPCNDAKTYGAAAVGKYFRYKDSRGYNYDYKFLDYVKGGNTYFLVGFPCKKQNGTTVWWVVMIAQATPKLAVVEEGRIMCEDLGDTGDFDFNDVVFDAQRFNDGHTEITLIAAGGELPITVAGVDVHEKLGSMKNTGVGDMVEPYTFTVNNVTSIKDIPVVVYPDGIGNGDAAVKYQLEAPVGKVPQKICTPRGCHFAEEYENIKNAYTEFSQWVQDDDPAAYLWVENKLLTDLDLTTK